MRTLIFALAVLAGTVGCDDLQEKVNDAVIKEVTAIRCRDCNTKVSKSAENCPKCGAEKPHYDKEAYAALLQLREFGVDNR